MSFEGEYYKDEKWSGKIKKFNFLKELEFEGEILYGKKHGKIKEYSENNLIFEGEYLYGEKNGHAKEYNKKGKLEFEGEYLNNVKWKGKEYHINSDGEEIESEFEYENGKKNGKVVEYFKGGKIRFRGEYVNDIKWYGEGYNPAGELVYNIKNGKGLVKEYNFEGNLKDNYENHNDYWD